MTALSSRYPRTASARRAGATALLARLLGRTAARVGVVLLFTVSAALLTHVGYGYMSEGGNALTKFHPSTILLILAAAALLIGEGVSRPLAETAARFPGTVAMAAGFAVLAWSCIMVQRYPVSQIVDTFVPGLVVFLILSRAGQRDLGWFGRLFHILFTINALVAILEMTTPFRLVPTYIGDELVVYEWRATALLGHPLSNAMLTGVYILLLTGPAGRIFPAPVRVGLFGLQMVAMMAFGGRTALVLLVLFLALRGAVAGTAYLSGRRFRRSAPILALPLATIGAIAMVILFEMGLFDRFIGRFIDDNGSAATRAAMFRVFDRIDPAYFLFGPEPWLIRSAQWQVGSSIAIESFIVGFVALYGLLVSLVFFAGLALFMREVVRFAGRPAILPLVYFFVVAAGANSISAKSTDLTMAIALAMVLPIAFRTDPDAPPRGR